MFLDLAKPLAKPCLQGHLSEHIVYAVHIQSAFRDLDYKYFCVCVCVRVVSSDEFEKKKLVL